MTRFEHRAALVAVVLCSALAYLLAPGLGAMVLVVGAFGLAVADYRVAGRRSARDETRRRLIDAAHRNGTK